MRERVGKAARGALSSCILVHLVLPRCPGASDAPQLAAELVQASIFVLIEAAQAGRPAGSPLPHRGRLLPGPFACARCTAQSACSRRFSRCLIEFLRLSPLVFVVVCRVPAWPARVGICVRSDILLTMYGDGGHVGTLRTRPDGRKCVDKASAFMSETACSTPLAPTLTLLVFSSREFRRSM